MFICYKVAWRKEVCWSAFSSSAVYFAWSERVWSGRKWASYSSTSLKNFLVDLVQNKEKKCWIEGSVTSPPRPTSGQVNIWVGEVSLVTFPYFRANERLQNVPTGWLQKILTKMQAPYLVNLHFLLNEYLFPLQRHSSGWHNVLSWSTSNDLIIYF